jgi:heme exporter protein A
LSLGQRRRAALARLLLAGEAPLWLLDEPFTALDVDAARFTGELIAQHAARGGAAVFTTHQPSGLDAAVARVIELG